MPEEREIICVTCPMGCTLRALVEGGEVSQISGQACKRGVAFAAEEILAPHRMFTTSVTIRNGTLPLLPVRSRSALPKHLLLPAAATLRQVAVDAPISLNDVIYADILGSGVDIVASRDIECAEGK